MERRCACRRQRRAAAAVRAVSTVARVAHGSGPGRQVTMKIRRKLLLTFTLAGGVVAIAGASGIEPLFRIANHARDAKLDVRAVAVELQRAFTLTYAAAAIIVMLSMLTTLRIAQRLTRLRKDADNLAKGIGEGIKVSGDDEIDLVAAAFVELHGTMKN